MRIIDDQHAQLSKQRKHRLQEYSIGRNFSRWSVKGDDSERAIYRRLAALLDILFDDIGVVDGEHACEAIKL
ncbi:uncharacterized protein BX664DRAFT_353444 [Halteromyces radiatus]|uniref:uncharacterized protein n=1 Tax=Halteromyces radiatus TaxID=101107 RepID=UPI00221F9BE3|nr:uncharacterized protein BX664DRAFT_353444 [Halteromyces radiatus]KAI8078863.1 hypothetical protein BX664DRAFT_353444 [Halteromyces radiatus]